MKKTILLFSVSIIMNQTFSQVVITLPDAPALYNVPGSIKGINYVATAPLTYITHPDFENEFKKLNVGTLRWPHGSPGNNYNWQKGLQATSTFNFKEAVDFIRKYNMEMNYMVNYGNGFAAEAADLVRFCNSTNIYWSNKRNAIFGTPLPLNIKIWEIGNEISNSWEWGYSWISEAWNDTIFLRNGNSKIVTKRVTDSLYYFGGSFWREGWIPAGGELDTQQGILGTEYRVQMGDVATDTAIVKVDFPKINPDSVRVWYVDTVITPSQFALLSQSDIYNFITSPIYRLNSSYYEVLGDTAVMIYPPQPLTVGEFMFVEYQMKDRDGAFEFRDSMLAADPSIKIGYCVTLSDIKNSGLINSQAFLSGLAISPPHFMIEHPYNGTLMGAFVNNNLFAEAINHADTKVKNFVKDKIFLDSISQAIGINPIGLGLTEWNIILCDQCPSTHPYHGMLGALYIGKFWSNFYKAVKDSLLDIKVINHFALIASGQNFLHLFHVNSNNFEVEAEAVATRLVNQTIGNYLFDIDSITNMPNIYVLTNNNGVQVTDTVQALNIYGGVDSLNGNYSVLILNKDDSSSYQVQLNFPSSNIVDSVFVETLSGEPDSYVTQISTDTLAANNNSLNLNIPKFSITAVKVISQNPSSNNNHITNKNLAWNLYPNPNNGSFWVTLNQNFSKAKISVTNVLGETIFETTTSNFKTEFDLGAQPNGIYFIRINSEAGRSVRKIIINK